MKRNLLVLGLAIATLSAGCKASVKAKASTSEDVHEEDSVKWEGAGESAPDPSAPKTGATGAPATTKALIAAPAPVNAPPGCPIECYVAAGAERVSVTDEESTQLRAALDPVFARMRMCGDSGLRRRMSPTLNLRISPDGSLDDVGVDPNHPYDTRCVEDAAQTSGLSVSLPGRKNVRCSEHCAAPAKAKTTTTTRSKKKR